MAKDDLLLTRAEVEEQFGISKRFLELAKMRGEGPPYVCLGRLIRYRAGDLRNWIDGQTVNGGAP